MTRAEKIRGMTDEELAQLVMNGSDKFCRNKAACHIMLDKGEIPDEWCLRCALRWLREQVPEK